MRVFCAAVILWSCGSDPSRDSDSSGSAWVDDTDGVTDPRTQLALGEAPPDFTLIDSNPSSITYGEPVTVTDKTGFVTGWYFFKSS